MKSYMLILFFVFSIGQLIAQDLVISDAKVSFTFVSKKVDGTISGFSSSSKIDKDDITKSKFIGSVQTRTLDTGNFLRNWSLRGGKYFDADNHPNIKFESEAISETKNGFDVKGQLTMKGLGKPVTIAFKKIGDRLVGTMILFSSDFDIEIMKKSREANKVEVELSFKLE